MGLKDAWNRQMERSKAYNAELRAGISGRYALTAYVQEGEITSQGVTRPVAGAVAEFETGGDQRRTTLTRVAAGAILAGPAGAIVGGLFRKNKSRAYVTVTFPDGSAIIIDGPMKDEKQLRDFARIVQNAGRHFAEAEAS